MHATVLKKDQDNKWDSFAYSHAYSSIHQTTRWAHFQSNVPSRDQFWIVAILDKHQKIQAGTILIRHSLPKSNYCWFYSPRGPLLSYQNPKLAREELDALMKAVKTLAKQEKAVFYRVDPLLKKNPHNKKSFNFPKFRFSPLGFQPKDTLILDLKNSHEEILKQMKQKGRYNIRLAERKHVKVVEVTPPALKSKKKTVELIQHFQHQIESYFNILQETIQRDKFYGHRLSFYKNMVEKLAPNIPTTKNETKEILKKELHKGFAKLYLAEYTPKETHETQYIAGIIVTHFKDTAIYYYGASSNEFRNVMAPYLLQWHAIKEAKSLGCKEFDFLGIAPPSKSNQNGSTAHPWYGVTAFKRKFVGEHHSYLPAQEFAFRPFLYLLYKFAKKLRKIFR